MPVTLQDVATKLSVSAATVSRALAGYPGVAPATRQRVLQAAQEMGYHPNVTARRLQKQRTDTIGFIIPTHGPRFSDPFFSEILAGIGNQAADHRYDLLVSTRAPGAEEMEVYQRMVQERRVDGLLVVRTRRQDHVIADSPSLVPEDQIDPRPHVAIDQLRESGHVGLPAIRVISEEVVVPRDKFTTGFNHWG